MDDKNTKLILDAMNKRFDDMDAKFDAKFDAMDDKINALDTKIDAVDAKVYALDTKVDAVDAKVYTLDTKVDAVDAKVYALDTKVDAVDAKVDALDTKIDAVDAKVYAVETKFDKKFNDLQEQLNSLENIVTIMEVEHGAKIQLLLEYASIFIEQHDEIIKSLDNINEKLDDHEIRIQVLEEKFYNSK